MKKCLLLFVLVVFCMPCFAQKIHFTDSSNHWKGFSTDESYPMPTGMYRWEFFGGHDTVCHGYTYTILAGSGGLNALVREDTVAGKVYAVFYNYNATHDSTEQVMYDYNLVPGDTLFTHMDSTQFGCMVLDTGSVTIGNQNYRVQHFVPVVYPGFPQSYYVIEGIGCLSFPTFPLVPAREFPSYLTCFYHNGIQPVLSGTVAHFDNNASCKLAVPDMTSGNNFTVTPNPAHGFARADFSRAVSGSLQVLGSDGRLCKTIPVVNVQQVSVDCRDITAGSYFLLLRSPEGRLNGWQKIVVE